MVALRWLALFLLGHFVNGDGDSSCLLSLHRKKPVTGGGILFIVRSHEDNYETRLRAIMDTWGQEVLDSEANDVIFMGNKEKDKDPKVLLAKNCGADHWLGLCCKTATSLITAYHYGKGKFNWYFVLDDDIYLHQENAMKVLSKYDSSIPRGLGIVGCGHCLDEGQTGQKEDEAPAGFCGGGGYVLSQAGLREWMKPSTGAFFDDYMGHIMQSCDDVTSACRLRERGIKVEPLEEGGLNGWELRGPAIPDSLLNTAQMEAMASTDPLPITFHYVKPEIVRAMHQQFQKLTLQATNTSSLIALAASRRVQYQEQLQCYISKLNARRESAKGAANNATNAESLHFGEVITC